MYNKPKGILFLFDLVVHRIAVLEFNRIWEYGTSRLLVVADFENSLRYIYVAARVN